MAGGHRPVPARPVTVGGHPADKADMGTEASTQEIPRVVLDRSARHEVLPHEVVFETAMARLDALTWSWQETLAGFAEDGGTGRHSAAAHAAPARPADDVRPVDPTSAAAVAARAQASRWRRHLAA